MDSIGGEFLHNDCKDGYISNSVIRRTRAAALAQPYTFRTMFSYNVSKILILASIFFGTISASANFSVHSSSYNCSTNLICLGQAHVFTNTSNNNGIEVGRLSLIYELEEMSLNGASIAYYNEPVRLLDPSSNRSASFNTSFVVDVVVIDSPNHGDGMAFVISADSSADTLGSPNRNLGIFNADGRTLFKSIVVEFDGYDDSGFPAYDISDNHLSFDFMNISYAVAVNMSHVNVSLWSNLTMYAWVEYSYNTQLLEVRVSNSNSRPVRSVLNYTVDLFDVAEEYMWVGFSAGSRDFYSNYYIGNWTFESSGIPASSPVKKNGGKKVSRILGISLGIPAFLLACIFVGVYVQGTSTGRDRYRHCRMKWMEFTHEEHSVQVEGMPERFSYKQLSDATRGFSEEAKLGQGGFGSVYRGVLPSSGVPVAVKKINGESTQGEKEFMAEVSIISRLSHRHLIQLLGWCKDSSKGKYLLVYELMPNGSLDKVLFGRSEKATACLSWPQRFNIVVGTAAALDYLHQGWRQQVIHRDIKSSNIMLDEDWNPKLGDFGLARLVDHQKVAATTMVAGTCGYIAPEVAGCGKFTDKSDVFAFGAMVLEVACGRTAISTRAPQDEIVLVDWVWERFGEGNVLSTVDKRLGEYDTYWMEVILTIGLLCSHPNALARPSMRQVVQILAGDAPVPAIPPSKPVLMFSSDFHGVLTDGSRSSRTGSSFRGSSRSIPMVSTTCYDSNGVSILKSPCRSSNASPISPHVD